MLRVDRRFNLLATCPRNREFFAIRGLESILMDLGDESPTAWKSGISGVVLGLTGLDQYEVPYRVRELLRWNPWVVRDIKRLVPIEFVVDTDLGEFSRVAGELARRIPGDASYKVELRRRYTQLGRMEIIDAFASAIPRRVSLEEPDYIVWVEVLGPKTGVSLVRPDGVLNVEREVTRL